MSYRKKKIRNLEILYKEKKAIKQKCVRNQFIVVFFLIKLKTSVNLLKKKKKKKLLKYKLLKSKKLDQITP